MKPAPVRRRAAAPNPRTAARAVRPLAATSGEEYLLALLLQNPGLKAPGDGLSAGYFESSENREIFNAWQATGDRSAMKARLDPAIHEHLDAIINRSLPATKNDIEQKYADCVIELRRKYLRSLAAKKAASGEVDADPARLEENMEISNGLRELDAIKSQKRTGARR